MATSQAGSSEGGVEGFGPCLFHQDPTDRLIRPVIFDPADCAGGFGTDGGFFQAPGLHRPARGDGDSAGHDFSSGLRVKRFAVRLYEAFRVNRQASASIVEIVGTDGVHEFVDQQHLVQAGE